MYRLGSTEEWSRSKYRSSSEPQQSKRRHSESVEEDAKERFREQQCITDRVRQGGGRLGSGEAVAEKQERLLGRRQHGARCSKFVV